MPNVTSKDGTPIAYERTGSGSAVILVGGGIDDGSENAPLVPELAERFAVVNYARRGRGGSGDTLPYAVEREIEAAAAGSAIDRLAVYEVPYNPAEDWPPRWREYRDTLDALLAEDRRGDAVELFMRLADTPADSIAYARGADFWPGLEALAPTLAYDAACLGNGQPPAARLATITQPTLVATGGAHDADAAEWVRALDPAADAIAAAVPNAQRATFEGQGHVADPKAVAPLLERLFTA